MGRIRPAASALAMASLLAGCGASIPGPTSQSGPAGDLPIHAVDYSYNATYNTVPPGATVRILFTNNGSTTHNMTQGELKINQDTPAGQMAIFTFTAPQAGSFIFHCRFHPTKMMGTITIAGSSPTALPSSSASASGYGY